MLSQIFFVALVLVVAALMAVDLIRTRGESAHGHAERQAFGADRVLPVPSHAAAAGVFSPEPGRGLTVPAAVAPLVAVPPPAPALAPRPEPAPPVFDFANREAPRPAAVAVDGDRVSHSLANLSHRSQALVERQIRLIEDLERGEPDGQRRASLSKLNRIAVRIHRNAENLLVLAGHHPAPVWNQPVRLAQLVRAALAEVEDSERATADIQAEVAVRGPAVNDLVHLLVELTENAASFSAAEMPIAIKGQILATGGALLDITDRGIGMSAKDMAYANHQLDNPPPGNIDVPKWMGLLVVGRLAARHGIRVRLNQPELGGLTALVWLPDEILTPYAAAADPGLAAAGLGPAAVTPAAFPAVRPSQPEVPATPRDPAWSARTPQAPRRAEPPAARLAGPARPEAPNGGPGVVLPQADSQARSRGLPIFDDVESRWTRTAGEVPGPVSLTAAEPTAGGLPRRPPTGTQPARVIPANSAGAPGRAGAAGRDRQAGFIPGASQGWTAPADEASPDGPGES